jgi:CBS domain-containing protein
MDQAVTVTEIMTREYVGVSESDTVGDAVDLMLEEATGGVVVLRGAEPVGTLTTADALAFVGDAEASTTPVGDVMSGTVPSVEHDAPIVEAAGVMADAGIDSLLVTGDEGVVGVVSDRDVVRAMATLADHASLAEPADVAGMSDVSERQSAAPTAVEAGGGSTEQVAGEYATQSVCEICGSLTPDLHDFNGQLICGDCREI